MSDSPKPTRDVTVRKLKLGEPSPEDEYWRKLSVEERLSLVWELTVRCEAIRTNKSEQEVREQRLQRSVVRVLRPGR
jgi:hypothetical protein